MIMGLIGQNRIHFKNKEKKSSDYFHFVTELFTNKLSDCWLINDVFQRQIDLSASSESQHTASQNSHSWNSLQSSPVHYHDLRDVAPKLSYQLYNQTALSSPSAADNLRSTGHVRFFDGRLQDGNTVGSGGDSTRTAFRMPPELCDPVSSDDLVCMAGSSLMAPSSNFQAHCLREQTPYHFQFTADDLPPPSVTAVIQSLSMITVLAILLEIV